MQIEDPVLSIAMDGDDKLAVMVSIGPFLRVHGTDPAVWAEVLATAAESLCKAHQEALTDDAGNHPPIEDVRERLMEHLLDAIEAKAGEVPAFESGEPD